MAKKCILFLRSASHTVKPRLGLKKIASTTEQLWQQRSPRQVPPYRVNNLHFNLARSNSLHKISPLSYQLVKINCISIKPSFHFKSSWSSRERLRARKLSLRLSGRGGVLPRRNRTASALFFRQRSKTCSISTFFLLWIGRLLIWK